MLCQLRGEVLLLQLLLGVVMFFCSDFSSKWTIVPMTRFAPNFSFVLFKGTVFKACETTGG